MPLYMKNHIFFIFLTLILLTLTYRCSAEQEEPKLPVRAQYILTVTSSEGGSVSPNATGSYYEGATITITATPDDGYEFDRWEGSDFDNSGCGFARHCRTAITMNSNRDVKAFFKTETEDARP